MSDSISNEASRKPAHISRDKRRECLELFDKGFGYKRTAKESGLNAYTVREYLRRYKAGDLSWAERGRAENL